MSDGFPAHWKRPVVIPDLGRQPAVLKEKDRPAIPQTETKNPWLAIHKYGPEHKDSWEKDKAEQWYLEWTKTIPSYGCSCQKHWEELTETLPPEFDSAKQFFEWSWKAHNEVSINHSHKPTITLEEAYGIYWNQ